MNKVKLIFIFLATILFSLNASAHQLEGKWYNHSDTTTVILDFRGTAECAISIFHKDVFHGMGFGCGNLVFGDYYISVELDEETYIFSYHPDCGCLRTTEIKLFGVEMEFFREGQVDVH